MQGNSPRATGAQDEEGMVRGNLEFPGFVYLALGQIGPVECPTITAYRTPADAYAIGRMHAIRAAYRAGLLTESNAAAFVEALREEATK